MLDEFEYGLMRKAGLDLGFIFKIKYLYFIYYEF